MVTIQKVCRLAKNEAEVRLTIDAMWKDPDSSELILFELRTRNEELYRFEEILEGKASNGEKVANDKIV